MKINNNIPALRTLNQLNRVNDKSSKTMLKLSSGLRINSAADDSAGLAISQKMDTQIKGLQQANRNSMDGISMVQTAEGAYNEIEAMLQRISELTVQAASGTYDTNDKGAIKSEIQELKSEIEETGKRIEFNKKKLLTGAQEFFDIQVGANSGQFMRIESDKIALDGINSKIQNVLNDIDTNPHKVLSDVGDAIAMTSEIRGLLGAYQNRLEHTVSNLGVSEENITAALSRVQDADMALEMANFTQQNILSQAATSMLAQANQRPQQVLQLLQK